MTEKEIIEKLERLLNTLSGNKGIDNLYPKACAFNAEGKIISIDLSNRNITDLKPIQPLISGLQSLERLHLGNNSITNIEPLSVMENLSELHLGGNKITAITALANFRNLSVLDLDRNEISNFTPLKRLENLTTLGLSFNGIRSISFLEEMRFLKRLSLIGNPMENLVPLKNLTELKTLRLGLIRVSDTTSLAGLKRLESLLLHQGQIEDISFLKHLNKLKFLSLPTNLIKDLSALEGLIELENVNLNENNITDLSPLKNLKKLSSLSLGHNKIRYIPEWLLEFDMDISVLDIAESRCIDISRNPIENVPPEIVIKGKESIRNYFDQMKKEKDYLFEAKLILVGEERAGKSTLADALSMEDFQIDLDKPSTHGINVSQWMIPKSRTGIEKDFCFNIWDFGGQEIYHSTHQFFLTKRSMYLFITEARKDLRHEDFYYWLNIINALAGDSPVLVIKNKTDQDHKEVSIDTYKTLFPQIYGNLKNVSCNSQHPDWETIYKPTLNGLKASIYYLIKMKGIKGIGDELPKSWVTIRKEINKFQEKGINHFPAAAYFSICEMQGLNIEQALYLSDYFHDLGVFLHFKDDIQLKDTIFINHNWVTRAIYNVFDNKKVKEAHGKFTDKDLMEIWNASEFSDKQAELLNLMKNPQFKICYQHENKYYLAPNLFSDRQPSFYWPHSDCIKFQFRYEFMPKGILSQLIVAMHKYIDNDTFWLHGVLFKYRNSKALVKEDRFSKNNLISIQVTGKERRDLLSIIISNIEMINSSYSNLKIFEEFGCNCSECTEKEVPYYFATETLNRCVKKGRRTIECQVSFEPVGISSFLGAYIPVEEVEKHLMRPDLYRYDRLDKILSNTEILKNGQIMLTEKLDDHYQFLMNQQANKLNHKEIERLIQHIEFQNSQEAVDKILDFVAECFNDLDKEMESRLQNIVKDIKKTDNWKVKAKFSIPLLNLVGINIDSEFELNKYIKKIITPPAF